MPFLIERMDSVWRDGVGGVELAARQRHVKGRVFGCIFDDLFGLQVRDEVGVEQILFETDYPHSDGTFPHSRKVAHGLFTAAGMNVCRVPRSCCAATPSGPTAWNGSASRAEDVPGALGYSPATKRQKG